MDLDDYVGLFGQKFCEDSAQVEEVPEEKLVRDVEGQMFLKYVKPKGLRVEPRGTVVYLPGNSVED
jgi:hypothetical protein